MIMLNITNTDVSLIVVLFTDQNSEPLQIKDNLNMNFVIG